MAVAAARDAWRFMHVVSRVTSLAYTFSYAEAFNQDIGSWNGKLLWQ